MAAAGAASPRSPGPPAPGTAAAAAAAAYRLISGILALDNKTIPAAAAAAAASGNGSGSQRARPPGGEGARGARDPGSWLAEVACAAPGAGPEPSWGRGGGDGGAGAGARPEGQCPQDVEGTRPPALPSLRRAAVQGQTALGGYMRSSQGVPIRSVLHKIWIQSRLLRRHRTLTLVYGTSPATPDHFYLLCLFLGHRTLGSPQTQHPSDCPSYFFVQHYTISGPSLPVQLGSITRDGLMTSTSGQQVISHLRRDQGLAFSVAASPGLLVPPATSPRRPRGPAGPPPGVSSGEWSCSPCLRHDSAQSKVWWQDSPAGTLHSQLQDQSLPPGDFSHWLHPHAAGTDGLGPLPG
ncbi:laforin-like [Loxodonta africana]|uniref:laforin-like n=1 Tax=Loxodonta africana TaxID=9785 RepID=UPI0030D25A5C